MHDITAKMLDPAGHPLQGSATFTMAQTHTTGDHGEVYSGSVTAPVDRDGQAKAHVQRMISTAIDETKAELRDELTPQITSKLDAAVFAEYTATDHR